MTCKACGAADVRAYQCGGENVRYHCEPCGHVWTDPPIRVSTREHRLTFVPCVHSRPAGDQRRPSGHGKPAGGRSGRSTSASTPGVGRRNQSAAAAGGAAA